MQKTPFEVSLNDFVYNDSLEELKALPSEKPAHDLCRIEIELNFSSQKLIIVFTKESIDDGLNSGEIKFDTMVSAMSNGSPCVISKLSYACSEEYCEMNFIEKHLSGLLATDYATLATHVLPLITNGTAKAGKSFTRLLENHCLYESYESDVDKWTS
jgi:hypothetical protein